MRIRRLLLTTAALTLAAPGGSALGAPKGDAASGGTALGAQQAKGDAAAKRRTATKSLRPVAFRSCGQLVRHAKARALDVVTPGGIPMRFSLPGAPIGLPMPMPPASGGAERGDSLAA